MILADNEVIYAALKNKLSDPRARERANFWYPKVILIRAVSEATYLYIDSLKKIINKKSKGPNDKEIISMIFAREKKGSELFSKLTEFKRDLLSIDSSISYNFDKSILLTTRSFDMQGKGQGDFTNEFFNNASSAAALAVLSKFQNNIATVESKMITFCFEKSSSLAICTLNAPILAQSSAYVKAGEKIEITAGIGQFIIFPQTRVMVNNDNAPLKQNGIAVYNLTAVSKPGRYSVPVRIEYIDEDGKESTVEMRIKYTVVNEPCPDQ